MPKRSYSLKNRKKKGGLSLRCANMDCGAPFHPQWGSQYNSVQSPNSCNNNHRGGKRKSLRNRKKR